MRKDNGPLDLSEFPVEVLEIIFGYLKAEDECTKPLIEACTTFRDILVPRLTTLRLDFDRIYKEQRYPTIQRSYNHIKFYGSEIDSDITKGRKVLESSRDSVTKLSFISSKDDRCFIKVETLHAILKLLSNVEEIVMTEVFVLPLLRFEKIEFEWEDYPELLHLRKLTLEHVAGPIDSVFKKAKKLEEIIAPFDYLKMKEPDRESIYNLLSGQTKLKKFQTINSFHTVYTDQLETLISGQDFFNNYYPEDLCEEFPALRELKITNVRCGRTITNILARGSSETLETIEIDGEVGRSFTVHSILPGYPSLKVFKSYNVNWEKVPTHPKTTSSTGRVGT